MLMTNKPHVDEIHIHHGSTSTPMDLPMRDEGKAVVPYRALHSWISALQPLGGAQATQDSTAEDQIADRHQRNFRERGGQKMMRVQGDMIYIHQFTHWPLNIIQRPSRASLSHNIYSSEPCINNLSFEHLPQSKICYFIQLFPALVKPLYFKM